MQKLMENSISISGTAMVCWPQFGKEETIDMTGMVSKFNGRYATNNSTIAYVVDNVVFVTPYTRQAMETILEAGLVRDYFYVPFSNGDYPKYAKAKWDRLLSDARESYYRDFEIDCAKWCDQHRIGKLDGETMAQCFRIPRGGVPVRHTYYEDTIYPILRESGVDCTTFDKLGRFCANNGRVVFVYRDGHTYVFRGYRIIDELRNAGYKEGGLFVPFSNGEEITDPYLASQWEKVSRK